MDLHKGVPMHTMNFHNGKAMHAMDLHMHAME
jgi:hypothetical protein